MKKIVIIALLILAGGVIVAAFLSLASKPDKITDADKEKALVGILGRKPNLNPNAKTGNVKYDGEYTAFSYPAMAKIYTYRDEGTKKNTSMLESFSFDLEDPRLVFNLSVTDNQAGLKDVKDISGAKYRADKSNGYTGSEIDVKGEKGLVFSKNESSDVKAEKTVFFLRNNKVYSIAISGNNSRDVSELFDTIMKSLTFLP